ncbi:canopy homolog 1 [Pelobates cultripes]|uniref:Canopy homolog 1 n=1 Tax=Pelobates cultripes TaxID=61616 RepID=A0AAD1RV36_PELCU|nr:canopy homolog 1 [Pelobates cultripes]
MAPIVFLFGIMMMALLNNVDGKRDPVLYCGACRALVDELLYEIRKVNPKKTVEVGSFRISPDGTQEKNKVPLAKSEQYLTELIESICEKMDDYGLYTDPGTQEKSYKRFAPRENEPFISEDFNNFKFNPEEPGTLKYACTPVRVYVLVCVAHFSLLAFSSVNVWQRSTKMKFFLLLPKT